MKPEARNPEEASVGGTHYSGPRCGGCGTAITPGERFCGGCGKPAAVADTAVSTAVCRTCRAAMAAGELYCGNCGTSAATPAGTSAGTSPVSAPGSPPGNAAAARTSRLRTAAGIGTALAVVVLWNGYLNRPQGGGATSPNTPARNSVPTATPAGGSTTASGGAQSSPENVQPAPTDNQSTPSAQGSARMDDPSATTAGAPGAEPPAGGRPASSPLDNPLPEAPSSASAAGATKKPTPAPVSRNRPSRRGDALTETGRTIDPNPRDGSLQTRQTVTPARKGNTSTTFPDPDEKPSEPSFSSQTGDLSKEAHAELALAALNGGDREVAMAEAKEAIRLGLKKHPVFKALGLKP